MLTNKKIGILGGGQLGKMLCHAAMPWHLNMHILDKDKQMSAAAYCTSFTSGNFKNYKDVMEFGKQMDIITIEIEHVNLEALSDLQKMGKKIFPGPEALKHIVDKGLQKTFFTQNQLPTSDFTLHESKAEIIHLLKSAVLKFPFVQKARREGYDGRGVVSIRSEADIEKLLDVPSVVEDMVQIDREIAVMTAQNPNGEIICYDPVEMVFKDEANILDVLISPARTSETETAKLKEISKEIISRLNIIGVLAIEFFISVKGEIFINEIAPRPHNSGHQTIENNIVSQYEQHLRAILNLPLIQPALKSPAVMMNILGEDGYSGNAKIEGKEHFLKMEDVYFHWYGKTETKAFRKMGHVTILDQDIDKALEKAKKLKDIIKVIA
jgi:5-(carboxyamino)imidazole ribonucleotide synthase